MTVSIDFMTTNTLDRNIAERLIDLHDALGVSSDVYGDLLGMKREEIEKLLQNETTPSLYTIDRLCDVLKIDFDSFVNGRYDASRVKAELSSGFVLPDAYADSSLWFARGRTIIAMRAFFENNYGFAFSRSVFRRVGLDPESFSDTEAFVHPLMVTDLLASFSSFGFHEEWAREIGFSAYKINKNTRIQKLLSSTRSLVELYRLLHEGLAKEFYDQLFEYRLVSLSHGQMVTETRPREETHGLLGSRVSGSRLVCVYRQGAYLSLAKQRGFTVPTLTESACLYKGDDLCRYHFSWDSDEPIESPWQ